MLEQENSGGEGGLRDSGMGVSGCLGSYGSEDNTTADDH